MSERDLIVYGARCSWWDSIDNAGTLASTTGHGLPCCPHCASVLFQQDEKEWWSAVRRYDAEEPGYVAFIEWLRGRCFPNHSAARAAYDARAHEDG